jgi:hypothetical protein
MVHLFRRLIGFGFGRLTGFGFGFGRFTGFGFGRFTGFGRLTGFGLARFDFARFARSARLRSACAVIPTRSTTSRTLPGLASNRMRDGRLMASRWT